MALRIRQYAAYGILNKTFSPEEITRRIGLEPDRARVMATPPHPPRWHIWKLSSENVAPEIDLTTQITTLVDRMRPYKEQIMSVVADIKAAEPECDGTGHSFTLYRHFDEKDGVIDGYQHRLLGWYFEPGVLQFLADINADVGADEYGQEFSWWQWRHKRRYYAPVDYDDSDVMATGASIKRNWFGRTKLVQDEPGSN